MRILYDGGILILGNLKDAVFQRMFYLPQTYLKDTISIQLSHFHPPEIRTIWRNANPITAELVSKNIIDGSNLDRAPINFEEFREEIQRIYNEETAKRAGATDVSQALTQTENSPVFVVRLPTMSTRFFHAFLNSNLLSSRLLTAKMLHRHL